VHFIVEVKRRYVARSPVQNVSVKKQNDGLYRTPPAKFTTKNASFMGKLSVVNSCLKTTPKKQDIAKRRQKPQQRQNQRQLIPNRNKILRLIDNPCVRVKEPVTVDVIDVAALRNEPFSIREADALFHPFYIAKSAQREPHRIGNAWSTSWFSWMRNIRAAGFSLAAPLATEIPI
jgi:hypothetical protein